MTSASAKTKKIFDGRYEIIGIVGRGSQSVVYHARHALVPTTEVALKVLVQGNSKKGKDNISERLRQEALAMVSARHKYVIRIDDFHVIDTLCYLSMEYAPLGDLRIYVSSKPAQRLVPELAERFMRQSLEALQFIHKTGIIHRDIKPDNILVMNEQEIRIADFGVATLPGQKSSLEELQSGVGTMDYMAPEVLEGIQYKESADIYALGVTFYELVSGLHPFKDVALSKQLEVRRTENVKPIKSLVPDLPDGIANAIMAAMRYELKDRPKSAQELIQILTGGKIQASSISENKPKPEEGSKESSSRSTVASTPAEPSKPASNIERSPSAMNVMERLEGIKRSGQEASSEKAADQPGQSTLDHITQAMQPHFKVHSDIKGDIKGDIKSEIKVETKGETKKETKTATKSETGDAETKQIGKKEIEKKEINPDIPSWMVKPVPSNQPSAPAASKPVPPTPEIITNPALKAAAQADPPKQEKRSEQELELSNKKTVSITRNEVEKIREQATRPLPVIAKTQPAWIKVVVAMAGVLIFGALIFWRPGSGDKQLSSQNAQDNTQQLAADQLASEQPQSRRLFPLFTSGIYEGQIENFVPGQRLPFSIISFEDRQILVVIIGAHGWTPSVVSTKDLKEGQSLRIASNGTILRFTGLNSEDGEVVGYFKNLVFGDEGQWTVRPKATKARKKQE